MEENERPAFRPFANFGPGMKLWLLFSLYFSCIGLLTLLSNSSALGWLSAGPDEGFPVNAVRWGYALQGILIFAVPAVVFTNVFPPERFRWLRLHIPVKPVMLILGILLMIVTIPAIDFIYEITKSQITDPEILELEKAAAKTSSWIQNMPFGSDLALLLFTSALIPAIVEELFFRGVVQQLFSDWTKKPLAAVWLSATVFAALHFDLAEMPAILLAGLFLGYAFHLTGSLHTSILMHFVFNGSSILLGYIAQHNAAFAAWEPSGLVVAASFALGFIFLGLLFRFGRANQSV